MKRIMILMLMLIALRSAAQEISGRVLDDKKEALPSAIVQVLQGGHVKGGTITDYDGNYTVKPLEPGYYNVMVVYVGLDTSLTTGVIVSPGQRTTINITMKSRNKTLKCITITAYKKPLIDCDKPASNTYSRGYIQSMPTTQINDLVSLSPGVYQSQRGGNISIGGARADGNIAPAQFFDPSQESYKKNQENDFMNVKASPVSTMSVDVDRASYSNIRRFINDGQKPPVDAVRVEEMINYFNYDYPQPEGDDPIAIQTEVTTCPWQKNHTLLHIGMQAIKVDTDDLPPSNLVFLIDVSGSMYSPERLPLLVAGMKLLVQNLRAKDKVSIVTYAGKAGLALPPTRGDHKDEIIEALSRLQAGGSTAGGAGITLAYKIAEENFIKYGNNRVLLATDGDFNVGVSSDNELEDLITKERETGVFLTCLGFGTDNFKDAKMEMMADKGNGNYDYIDNIQEAQKTLVSEFGGTLFTVAKDVKAQIEFNPAEVKGYRLIGYEDRLLNTEDFKDDKKDAGDMGSGHTVTVIYELIPADAKDEDTRDANDLKYQKPLATDAAYSSELATIKFRYKQPDGCTSKEMSHVVTGKTIDWNNATENTRFSETVAMFGMLLKNSKFKGSSTYDDVIAMANDSRNYDKDGYRAEFVKLVSVAKQLDKNLSAK